MDQIALTNAHMQWLSCEELQRLARQATPSGKQRFGASRLLLRSLLAGKLGCDPAAICFGQQPSGKPFIENPPATAVEFNLSHSGQWIALGLGEHPLGVDIEQPRKARDLLAIAQQYFHPDESAHLKQLQPAERHAAFYRYWTIKEAFFKARSTGIAEGLARIRIDPEQLAASLDPALGKMADWQLHYWLNPMPEAKDCHLALVVQAPSSEVEIVPVNLPETIINH